VSSAISLKPNFSLIRQNNHKMMDLR